MDSNSGSLQSSSGGDEEFDSRAESLSAFLNPSSNPSSHVGGGGMSSTQHPPNPYQHQTLNQSTLYDPLSSYLDVFTHSTPQTPMLNLDTVWAPRGGLRSEPNSTQPGSLTGLLSSSSPSHQQPCGQPQFHKPLPSAAAAATETGSRPPGSSDQANVPRNPKKRSRASRRAPTTVLTTDTSNFRAMVQEFTGIPAPPFSASPFPRTRLDLFSNASNLRSSFDPSPLPPNQPFILRPFAHKVQPPLFVSSTIAPTTSSIVTNTTLPRTCNFTSSASNSNSTTNYQLTPELGLPRQSQTLLSMQNPMSSTFQSLIQTPPPNVPIFGTKSQTLDHIPSSDPSSTIKGGILEDFGMSHGNLGTLSNLVTTGGLSLRSNNDNWSEGVGHNEGEQTHLSRPFNGNYGSNNPQRVSSNTSSCKMNFSASTSDFHGEKTTENVVSTRGEGMVDSWICSSD